MWKDPDIIQHVSLLRCVNITGQFKMLMGMQCKDRTMITDKKKKKKIMLIHTNKIIGSQHRNKIQTIHLPIRQNTF